jgi:hypothetical protein
MADREDGAPAHARLLAEPRGDLLLHVQRKVVTPNDFYDLADVEDRLLAFQDRYNFTAQLFNWTYTRHDLDDLLKRISAHEARASLS